MTPLELLTQRRSVLAKNMQEPGPTPDQLQTILQAAHRVPDHGKLGPWHFIVFEGDARVEFGLKLAEIYRREHPEATDKAIQVQANLLTRAPVVIAVISTPQKHIKIPEWEQILSAGAACQNILLAASAMGFGAQWLTEWYSYNKAVTQLLESAATDKIAGFIYIGSFAAPPKERTRPDLAERIRHW